MKKQCCTDSILINPVERTIMESVSVNKLNYLLHKVDTEFIDRGLVGEYLVIYSWIIVSL